MPQRPIRINHINKINKYITSSTFLALLLDGLILLAGLVALFQCETAGPGVGLRVALGPGPLGVSARCWTPGCCSIKKKNKNKKQCKRILPDVIKLNWSLSQSLIHSSSTELLVVSRIDIARSTRMASKNVGRDCSPRVALRCSIEKIK